VDRFVATLGDARDASPHTLRAYSKDLDQLLSVLGELGLERAEDVRPRHLRRYLARLDAEGLARATIQRKLSAARSLFRMLVDEGRLDLHPATGLRQRRSSRHLPKALGLEEIEALLSAPDQTKADGRRDRALLELVYSAGTRAAETVGIDLGDLDLGRGLVRVRGKGRKERLAPLGSHAVRAVRLARGARGPGLPRRPRAATPADRERARVVPQPQGRTADHTFAPACRREAGTRRGPASASDAAHPASQLRHAPARAGAVG
jgi:site-specific recombinase XerC